MAIVYEFEYPDRRNSKRDPLPFGLTHQRVQELLEKEHGFELQKELITRIRKEFKPTEAQKAMPYYEMILELIKNA